MFLENNDSLVLRNKGHYVSTIKRLELILFVVIIGLIISLIFNSDSTAIQQDNSLKSKSSNISLGKVQGVKTANLNGCVDIRFDGRTAPVELKGKLTTSYPYSDLIPFNVGAGTVNFPFYLSSESGNRTGGQLSEMWDVEFFDGIPPTDPSTLISSNNEFGSSPGSYPNDTHSSLVGRSTSTTSDLPDTGIGDNQYVSVTGSLNQVVLQRDASYIRARLRPDVHPDGTNSSVIASMLRVCSTQPTTALVCKQLRMGDNGAPILSGDYGNYYKGSLRYNSKSSKNYPYSNVETVEIPAGTITIPNAFAFDSGVQRQNVSQDSEIFELEFIDSSGNVKARSTNSPDLQDNVNFASWEGSLGTVTSSTDIVSIRAHHLPNLTSNQKTDDGLNVVGATVCYETVVNTGGGGSGDTTGDEKCGLKIGLIVDRSNSISTTEGAKMKTAAKGFVDALNGTPSQIAVAQFRKTATQTLGLTSVESANGVSTVKNTIDAYTFGTTDSSGSTNWEAAFYSQKTVDASIVVILTDGNPTKRGIDGSAGTGYDDVGGLNVNAGIARANELKAQGKRIIAVGIGDDLEVNNLKAVSGNVLNEDYFTTSFDTLGTQLSALATQLCIEDVEEVIVTPIIDISVSGFVGSLYEMQSAQLTISVTNPSDATLKNIKIVYPGGIFNVALLETGQSVTNVIELMPSLGKASPWNFNIEATAMAFHANTTGTRFDDEHEALKDGQGEVQVSDIEALSIVVNRIALPI